MSLFEWLGERRDPGSVGSIEEGSPTPMHWHPRAIVFRGALAIALAIAAGVAIVSFAQTATDAVLLVIVLAAYCGAAYWLTPRPALDNVGLGGGMVDHPFRWSDDVNRRLVGLQLFLWPGRFLTVSVRDLVALARGRRIMILPPRG